ncbi:hypothetical protein PILCRDRAFT_91243 [Piloderma croceum F 1598]|uniref:Uncharacterized protein n=1 Tax=Piloderma croceum (strain F 1598) TaxID=765440 RepID=A0A0C3FBH2_PILCF|nr:hypothetical protein PILCRDRAFT_91243 [Piloderma croceum F 1598]
MLQNSISHLPYNMWSHIETVYPATNVEHYADLYTLGLHEHAGMKAIFNTKPRHSKQKKLHDIKISEAHSLCCAKSIRTVKNSSNNVNSNNDLPANSVSNLSIALTPAQSPSPSPSPTLSNHLSNNEDDCNNPFRDLVGIENPIDDFFEILDQDQETHSEIMDLLGPTPLIHQSPVDATVKNQMQVASFLLLSVGPIMAAESNVAPSISSPART